jgi:hypothetical protein
MFEDHNSPQSAIAGACLVLIGFALLGQFWIGLIVAPLTAAAGYATMKLLRRWYVRKRRARADARADWLYRRAEEQQREREEAPGSSPS